MKKIVAAFLAGILVMMAGQVIADTASQIGKKVDGEASVTINGQQVSNAVIIQGKSYAPVRDIAEGLGADVAWKGSDGVVITRETEYDIVSFDNEADIAAHNAKIKAYNNRKAELVSGIEMSKMNIDRLERSIVNNTKRLEESTESLKPVFTERIEQSTKELAEEKAKLAQYEQELQELESTK